jgi:epoxyqueuosine reductase
VLIAIGNSGDPRLADLAKERLGDHSPLVRAMAVWALCQLLGRDAVAGLRARYLAAETDEAVRQEWGDGDGPE